MERFSLREFTKSVPTCVETDSLTAIWQRLGQSGCDRAVVLTEQQIPLGVVSLSRLVSLSLSNASINASTHASIHAAIAPASTPSPTLQQLCLSLQDQQPLLDDLTPVPLHWSLEEVQRHLDLFDRGHWSLMDASGRYVGLLDRLRLLQFMATRPAVPPAPPLQPSEPALLNPMIELLERLPLPLMLQTASGQMITQNLAWRQQVGTLRDPARISQEAGQIFDAAGVGRSRISPVESPLAEHGATNPYFSIWENSVQPNGTIPSAGSCLSMDADTCVCICPMANGQDRVWQFVKVPMGAVSSFKLAALEFAPDPDWRSLSQTSDLWLILAQDTTDQQQIVKELAAKNADLVQLNRLKDEFLSCISHELKTPLTAVLGLSSLLKDQALGDLNERQSRYAHLIHRSGRHLIAIVNNILDLTRIETGQMDLTPVPVQLEAVCHQAYQLAQQLQAAEAEVESERLVGAPEGEIHFSLEIQPGLASIVADELRLRQMLANLLSNALKFTEVDRQIGLKVEAWEGWVAFTVWDQGIGIPPEKQHLIFQKFQQLETPLTRQFKGTGVGLVLTQRLARLHGGDVTFTSIEGEGSEFTLLLPPRPAPHRGDRFISDRMSDATDDASESSFGITSHNRLALIVEATPHLVDDLTHQLVGLGYRVAIARSGTEALEKIRRLQPCAVFLNPLLPMLSGWDVLTLLKSDTETSHIPVVATAMRIDRQQAYQNGADAFLSLPIQPDALQRCLDQIVAPLPSEELGLQLSLTVLHLYENQTTLTSGFSASNLGGLLHPHQCRVLEVDDLDQADLLARVWKPDVVLLDGAHDAQSYMERFSQSPFLSALPVVTLTVEMTEAANQIPGLAVYPCLASTPAHPIQADSPELAALLQVMQLAVGMEWTPQILIFDLPTPAETPLPQSVRALMQYFQIAGFQSAIAQSWEDVLQNLQHQSVDLLLLCGDPAIATQHLVEMERALEPLSAKPQILFWNYLTHRAELDPQAQTTDEQVWGHSAQVLPGSLPMPDLLARVNQILGR
jgi:signal transduction histidine kinase/ActR/RegA family two-component response regulator